MTAPDAARGSIEDGLERIFESVARMTDGELIMLRGVWEDGDPTAREQAWQKVRATVQTLARADLLDGARARLAAWTNNYLTATSVEYGNFLINAGSGLDPSTVRRAALPPLLDAIAATLAADHLSDDEQHTLMEPIVAVTSSDPAE